MLIDAPISIGELFDKLTIIGLKRTRISDLKKLTHVEQELIALTPIADRVYAEARKSNSLDELCALINKLRDTNTVIWEVEDNIREHETKKSFGDTFIKLARDVYHYNDGRAKIKKEINLLMNSQICEEKSYTEYKK